MSAHIGQGGSAPSSSPLLEAALASVYSGKVEVIRMHRVKLEGRRSRHIASWGAALLLLLSACASSGEATVDSGQSDASGPARPDRTETAEAAQTVELPDTGRMDAPRPLGDVIEVDVDVLDVGKDSVDMVLDQDNDGDPDETDCEPLNPEVSSLAVEACNGYDDNCNGETDETVECPDGETCHEGQCMVLCGDGLCGEGEDYGECPQDCVAPCDPPCKPDLEECTQASTGQWVCAAKMVEVPAGTFWMGCNNCEGSQVDDDYCDGNEHPYHQVLLDFFEIDKTEVTAGQYDACVGSGHCESLGPGLDCTSQKDGLENRPVNCLVWSQAHAYCGWVGRQLCTEAQWEKAARGGCDKNGGSLSCKASSRVYPWGNQPPTCELTVMDWEVCGNITQDVCSRSPAGDSPYGLCDMAGNVWEFTADFLGADYYCTGNEAATSEPGRGCSECGLWPGWPEAWPNPTGPDVGEYYVLRGGSTEFSSVHFLRASKRFGMQPLWANVFYGFRCCRTPEP